MLRIDRCPESMERSCLRLSGHLTGPWVKELATACQRIPDPASTVALDLTELLFADLEGQNLLRRLQKEGYQLLGLSPFLIAQLGINPQATRDHE